uniref:Uncharacterized protein n=1 Tax=Heterorhabditis bacteriophora TaxID=37862 RepID=A0A1I7XEZ9_HETBA
MSLEFGLDAEIRQVDSSLEEEREDDDELYEPAPIKNILSENTIFPRQSSSLPGLSLLKNIKREPEDYLELECSKHEDNGDITPSPSPRVKHKRECAEVAKKKIKLEMRVGRVMPLILVKVPVNAVIVHYKRHVVFQQLQGVSLLLLREFFVLKSHFRVLEVINFTNISLTGRERGHLKVVARLLSRALFRVVTVDDIKEFNLFFLLSYIIYKIF